MKIGVKAFLVAGDKIPPFLFIPVIFWIGSIIFLPVDGWSHLYMPFVCLIGIAKILLVSPVLLPLICAGLVIQLWLALFAGGAAGREINKMLLVCIVIGGLTEFTFQVYNFNYTPQVDHIQNAWRAENSAPDEETKDFLGVWMRKFSQIKKHGVACVEKTSDPAEVIMIMPSEIPHIWSYLRSKLSLIPVVVGSAIFILLFALSERYSSSDQRFFYRA